jgi:hypothetical protein
VEASPDSLSQDKYRFASDVAMVRAAMNENESPGLTLAIFELGHGKAVQKLF